MMPPTTDMQDQEHGATVIQFPQGCREYLGKQWGYCPARATIDISGRGFCEYHHGQRVSFWDRPVWGRA